MVILSQMFLNTVVSSSVLLLWYNRHSIIINVCNHALLKKTNQPRIQSSLLQYSSVFYKLPSLKTLDRFLQIILKRS